ncbi:MAG: phosphotransferase [Proteobacteria bacterium]|nr:phosphotransferase [Pseudomonadota bacterium]
MTDSRRQELADWTNAALDQLLADKTDPIELESVSGDASFRRYFRARSGQRSFIAVDAPPVNENSRTFVSVSNLFRDAGVCTPKVFSVNHENGFMLIDDFGDELYLVHLRNSQKQNAMATADSLYRKAIDSLLTLQQHVDRERLDPYDRKRLHRELNLFSDWFCNALLSIDPGNDVREIIAKTFVFLEDAALSQPQVAVHRDYHSRNLMVLDPEIFGEDTGPGIIDFQDAVAGAYTYDLVSLLRDCYIRWQPQQVKTWGLYYLESAKNLGVIGEIHAEQFFRDFDLMGLQRHLKVMGIFARLSIRDNKPQFLADIPLVMQYLLEVGQHYGEMTSFLDWLQQIVLPLAKTKLKLES